MDILAKISEELNIAKSRVDAAVKLLDEGNTIPFIARYRKEVTGALDDVQLRDLSDRLTYLRNLEKRKEEVKAAIEELGKMTGDIERELSEAATLAAVEDIYRPYKPKKKTRASIAREKGLEPLAEFIFAQSSGDPFTEAEQYISEEKGVASVQDAIDGAKDIIAENISDDPEIRKILGGLYDRSALITSVKAKDGEEESVYENYYDYKEAVSKIPTHRILAIDRGEREGVLKAAVEVDTDNMLATIYSRVITGKSRNKNSDLVTEAAEDAYKRLIHPSIERRVRNDLTEKACTAAIKVFGDNLRQLLMQPPVKGMVTMGLDPAYRTGCKISVVDATGKVLDTAVVYPTPPHNKTEEAKKKLTALIKKYGVTAISIGNGTASHESEVFVADMIRELDTPVSYMVVSEAGASVYSASKLAQEEFPDFDVTQRSAVSIARRLQDPLSELVKIEPKAIGVGQYQHDMPPAQLSEALGGVVEDCVNNVGVDVNTASVPLLSYVAGINAGIAKNIVAYREENGGFTERKELLKVSKLGKKTYEQCAGFLRVPGGREPLDNTAVHPESYAAARKLLELCGLTEDDISGERSKSAAGSINAKIKELGIKKAAEQTGVGDMTLSDIVKELMKPGRDPRDELPKPMLRSDVVDINSLKEGMELKGTVRNITDFGAFVDIGVHQDGLVHISQLADKFVKHPLDVVKVGDIVNVKILGIDVKKNRISLTMKGIN
ncbi:MAG: RNA-binding transcriptional accessory protein [Ruminiclostridium sp.]|nr:RNA-binding transcriptional accessory protein [Ruminiclostridium sp.]